MIAVTSIRLLHEFVIPFSATLSISWLAVLPASAQFVDFDDLSLGAYSTGQTFVSGGVTFEVGDYNGLTGQAVVADAGQAPGSGREIRLENEDKLIIHMPAGTSALSFDYGAFCCDTGIVVNGLSSPLSDPNGHNFRNLDGTTLGRVAIEVDWMSVGGDNERGTITLRGPITTFSVSGTEFAIDNVSLFVVPEPAPLTHIFAAISAVFGSGLRIRRNSRY
jgi:hypothetical protein